MDQPGKIIFLNGVPNAGKTTLAVTVQEMLEEPYWHLSLDDFFHGYSARHRRGPNPPSFLKVMYGYLGSLRQLALCGNNIVAEAILTPDRLGTYLELFGDLPTLLIGLDISLEEAHRREQLRSDRAHYEVTARDLELIHAHEFYDLELDTARLAPPEAARQVLEVVASPPSVTAFQRLKARQRG